MKLQFLRGSVGNTEQYVLLLLPLWLVISAPGQRPALGDSGDSGYFTYFFLPPTSSFLRSFYLRVSSTNISTCLSTLWPRIPRRITFSALRRTKWRAAFRPRPVFEPVTMTVCPEKLFVGYEGVMIICEHMYSTAKTMMKIKLWDLYSAI